MGIALLGVAICVVLVFFITSIFCSSFNELFAQLIGLRAKGFERGITRLIEDHGLRTQVLNHPLVDSVKHHQKDETGGMTYLPSRNFAMALIDTLKTSSRNIIPASSSSSSSSSSGPGVVTNLIDSASGLADMFDRLPDSKVRTSLISIANSTERKVESIRAEVENWFDSSMDRVTDWYKSWVRVINLVIAFLLVIALNIDTIAIARAAATNPEQRERLVAIAARVIEEESQSGDNDSTESSQVQPSGDGQNGISDQDAADRTHSDEDLDQVSEEVVDDLIASGIPIGWPKDALSQDLEFWFLKALGLTITALAASIGAPFWFDLLTRLVRVHPEHKKKTESK